MISAKVELFKDAKAVLGEGPAWDAEAEELVWVDILDGNFFRERPDGSSVQVHFDDHVGAAMPSDVPGEHLLLLRDGFYHRQSDGSLKPLARPLADQPNLRFNDGKIDPRGRAFGGTMPYDNGAHPATLFRLDGATAVPVVSDVLLANGLGWSPDHKIMYFIDSGAQRIMSFGYDVDTGEFTSGASAFLNIASEVGMPDGLTVDDDGCVWVALWGGSACHRYTPAGQLDTVVNLPATQPTSMCFAGSHLSTLIVTSARYGLSEEQITDQPYAGALFAVDVNCTGPAATPWQSHD